MTTAASAATSQVDVEREECLDEDLVDQTPLLPSAPLGNVRRPRRTGAILIGLAVVAVVIIAGATRAPPFVMTGPAQSKFLLAYSTAQCRIDGSATDVVDYSPMVCMQFSDEDGVKHHRMSDAGACEEAKASPAYSNVVCCKTSTCGGGREKEDVACYVDGTFGGLTEVTYIRYPLAMGLLCSKYTLNDGSVGHQPAGKETCDSMKQSLEKGETWSGGTKFYKEVMCCRTDYCNGDGSASDTANLVEGSLSSAGEWFRRTR